MKRGDSKGAAVESEPVLEYQALKRLLSWDGVKRVHTLLEERRNRPNLFLIAPRILRVEGVHSDILRWLLNPKGWHGLGDLFPRRLLDDVRKLCGLNPEPSASFGEVDIEFTTGHGPIDILVHWSRGNEQFVLGIENKIDSPDTDDQLARYCKGLTEQFGRDRVLLAFLTLDGREPKTAPECPFACIGYPAVAALLAEAIHTAPRPCGDGTGLELARHYLDALRTDVMQETNTDIDGICRQLYSEHQDAWRAIRRRLPSERDELHAALGTAACTEFARKFGGHWYYSVKRDARARLYRRAWRAIGSGEDSPIVGLDGNALGLDRTYAHAHLQVAVATPDTDAGEQYRYVVRLKVQLKHTPPALAKELRLALEKVETIPERSQFTINLKSRSRMPSATERADKVASWAAKLEKVDRIISALDSVCGCD